MGIKKRWGVEYKKLEEYNRLWVVRLTKLDYPASARFEIVWEIENSLLEEKVPTGTDDIFHHTPTQSHQLTR